MGIIDEIARRLGAEVDPRERDLVLAALIGPDAIEEALAGIAPASPDATEEAPTEVGSVYLDSIEVSGFRGIGPATKVEFPPGPGLTLVVGRNGSGKSSFSDALEFLLTGDSYRWSGKAKEWQDGWRNLHFDAASITATFSTGGKRGPTTVRRAWAAGDGIDAGALTAQHHGEKLSDLDGLGWSEPLEVHRPLLSYSELGVIGSNPSSLFDALSGVLGLDAFADAAKLLADARLARERLDKDVKKRLKEDVMPALEGSEDARADHIAEALGGRTWELEVAAQLAITSGEQDRGLEAVAALEPPDTDETERLAAELDAAAEGLLALEGSDSHRAGRLLGTLRAALEHHAHVGEGPCPVCGQGRLDGAWREEAERQAAELTAAASAFEEAERTLVTATRNATDHVRGLRLPETDTIDLTRLRSARDRWVSLPSDPAAVAAHLRDLLPDVSAAVREVATEARERFSAQEAAWSPVVSVVVPWLDDAREAVAGREAVKVIKSAEGTLKDVLVDVRSDRFEPIASKSIELWNELRLQSNVHLKSVSLSGGARGVRRVDLDVTVDDAETAALGVVSQGELNCLALSLFFPRATLPESPFRFLVIDDPVQAMDPARVDGLARVFSQMAGDRQVIVFTHDERLPDALSRLQLAHTVKTVTRRAGSVVTVRDRIDPVNQYFQDARAVAADRELLDGVASRVAPGLCRLGLEAACVESVRRRRIGRGDEHHTVERSISEAKGLTSLASLAFFDDAGRGADVLSHINKWGRTLGDAFRDANRGAHQGFSGNLRDLINECSSLAARIRAA